MSTLKQKIKAKKVSSREIYGLFPDFTSRALGFKSKTYNLKDTLKAMRKVQTGFEIRTGARLKKFSEKDLMKGIAQ